MNFAPRIHEFQAALKQPLALLVGEMIGRRARFLGQSCAKRNFFGSSASLLHGHTVGSNIRQVKP
jgi:hypothetical protein